ncbi:hypothetical protein R3P38DRAFT_56718 [Favolaschia claudopus]|uniref:DUF6699 domain-containing protein n=1 Tax=Favolaschia claudopus TaxID=2862362 RepID=A0AAW0EKS6_9AGAR
MPGKHVHFSHDVVFPPTPSPTFSSASLPSSYGPVTPPNAFNSYAPLTASGSVTLHEVLKFQGPYPPALVFDIRLPHQNVRPSANYLDPRVLSQTATKQPLPSLVLIHPALGAWKIEVAPRSGKAVLVEDVLFAIYSSLRQRASETDFQQLPPARQSSVVAAFTARWSSLPPEHQQIEKGKGLKRVDFLCNQVKFAGLSPSQWGPNCFELVLS